MSILFKKGEEVALSELENALNKNKIQYKPWYRIGTKSVNSIDINGIEAWESNGRGTTTGIVSFDVIVQDVENTECGIEESVELEVIALEKIDEAIKAVVAIGDCKDGRKVISLLQSAKTKIILGDFKKINYGN